MFENKQFPTFLGIGTMKSGSTWLTELLSTHPEIWIPHQRSEVQYFDVNFEKGKKWYAQFFPDKNSGYKQVGEFTPGYMYDEEILKRIKAFGGIEKFIISLRNPVERAYSHYNWRKRNLPYDKMTFKELMEQNEKVVDFGFYAKHIQRLLEYFDKDQLCFLVFEDMVNDVEATKVKLAEFLEVNPKLFPKEAGESSANQSFNPKNKLLFTIAAKTGKILRDNDLYGVEKVLRQPFVMNLIRKPGKKQEISKADLLLKKELYEVFENDTEQLKVITGLSFKKWEMKKQELLKIFSKMESEQ